MGALIILPLLLLFGLLETDGNDDETADAPVEEATSNETNESDPSETVDLRTLLNTNLTTDLDDNVVGTAGSDFIDGQEGNDTLIGLGGADYLEGGPGDDSLLGGDGSDVLGGGQQDDYLVGGLGNDLLHGNSDDDQLFGQEGDDVLYGGHGADTISGGDGNDVLFSFMSNYNDPANDMTRPHELTTAYVLAFDQLAAANPGASSQEIANFLGSQGFGYNDLHTSAPDRHVDILEGGEGSDSLFLGAGDIGTGGAGEDAFILNHGNRAEDATIITDFDQNDDVLVLSYMGNSEPTVRLDVDGTDAVIISGGHVMAVIEGQAGSFDLSALAFVQAG